jgi:serine/threonine-protein kinase
MYELFAGKHPCDGANAKEIQKQLVSNRYKFSKPSKSNPEIPPELDRIILKCLRRKPEKRYQSMTEVMLDLSRIQASRI